MKLKTIQIFLIVYIVLALAQFAVKEFDQSQYLSLKPVFNGMMIGLVASCLIYYARIFVVAWLRNKKEETAKP
jgi:Na+-driven multidrug efflux pump